MSKKIHWESVSYEYDQIKERWKNKQNEEDELFEEEDEEENPLAFLGMDSGKLLSTPFGFFEVDDAFSPLNQFEFWIGHTNFNITQSLVDKLETVPGVEGLKVFSRYRFLISVGKMFSFKTIRPAIEVTAGCISLPDNVLEELKKHHEKGEEFYLYVYPNMKDYISTTAGDKNFVETCEKILSLYNTGGIIYRRD